MACCCLSRAPCCSLMCSARSFCCLCRFSVRCFWPATRSFTTFRKLPKFTFSGQPDPPAADAGPLSLFSWASSASSLSVRVLSCSAVVIFVVCILQNKHTDRMVFQLNNLMTCATRLYHVVYRYNKCILLLHSCSSQKISKIRNAQTFYNKTTLIQQDFKIW